MTPAFRLIVFDIDGTLENSRHEISTYTRNVILRAHAAGLMVSLATGKTLPAVQPLAQQLGLSLPMVMANGSILQYPHGRILHASFFPKQTVESVLELASGLEVDISVFTPESVYIQHLTPSVQAMMEFGAPTPREIQDWAEMKGDMDRVVKFVIMNMGGPRALKPLVKALDDHLDGRVSHFPTQPYMHEVLPPGEDKGSGVRRLADALDILPDQIIACGDGDNDAVMLKLAGVGVAVANATRLCQASGDVIVASNDQDGPARFLDGFLRSRRQ